MGFKERNKKMSDIALAVESRPLPSDLGGTVTHPLRQKKQDGQRLRSLVVDDDNMILKYVAQMLDRLGCQVETAQERPDVMNKLTTGTYDLLVTDLEMPEMNGYHLTQRIKKETLGTKVIIMTGSPEADCLDMMATRWVDGWLFKPFGLKELSAMLKWLGLLAD
jgi:CheY-like chemotaxis protein